MTYHHRPKTFPRLGQWLFSTALFLVCACLAACNKSDEGVEANTFVGSWYMSSYMEDINGNHTNDDPKLPLQIYESYSLVFTKDGKLQVHSQQDQSMVFDLSYNWNVTSDSRVILHLTEITPSGNNTYSIEVAALSTSTLVLMHDQYNTVQALHFQPPHGYNTNWLIFTRQ